MNPLKKKERSKIFNQTPPAKPDWLKVRIPFPLKNNSVEKVRDQIQTKKINTVCESASCPNLNYCWGRKTATYMLGGDICTRKCLYCDVASGRPEKLDSEEPIQIAKSAFELALKHVVITAVNRDDLEDGGANQFQKTIFELRKLSPNIRIEVLIPDFKSKKESLQMIFDAKPDILNHNLETVERLFSIVAKQKNYNTSLRVLDISKKNGFLTKTGLILGLGETIKEVKQAILDVRDVGVDILTLGQYIQPTSTHYPVQEYIKPEIFQELKLYSLALGFSSVFSGPLVRSSYHADEHLIKL